MIPATHLVGIGLGLLVSRKRRVAATAVAGTGLAWFMLLTWLGAGTSLGNDSYSGVQTTGVSSRISEALHMAGQHWAALVQNRMPAGFVGVLTAPAVGIAAVVFGENLSEGNLASLTPSFQSLPLYIFVPIGSVLALIWSRQRIGKYFANAFALVMVLNAAAWGAVMTPPAVRTFLSVTPTESSALRRVQQMIPQRDNVVVSMGISGAFAIHATVQLFVGTPMRVGLYAPNTWFVIAPYAGNEVASAKQSKHVIAALEHDRRARLEYSHAGIWAFRVHVRASRAGGRRYLTVR